MGSCIDLRKLQDNKAVEDAFSKLVSGKRYGYKTIIETKKEEFKCSGCGKILEGSEKFCPECGAKIDFENKQ